VDRLHHVAIYTARYDATADFYREVFGAQAPERCEQPSVVRIGEVRLHVFEHPAIRSDWSPARLHHFALLVTDLDEFVAVRDRLLAREACGEEVTDFGMHVSLLATDPDGGMVEVMLPKMDREALPFAVTPH
jgi:catechol 2,3-dioxygenase-like lactoylglutathione lyase family enzyme